MPLRRPIRAGAVAGAVTVFLALVGLIGGFTELNLVGEEVTFARLLVILPPFVVGYALARPRLEAGAVRSPTRTSAARNGALAGGVAGLVIGLATLFTDAFGVERIRAVFLNVTPSLVEFLTFGTSAGLAVVLHALLGGVVGGLGGAYRYVPDRIRRPLGTAIIAVLVMGFLQRIVPIMLDGLNLERDWLYSRTTGGLTWLGAVVTAIVAAGISIAKDRYGDAVRAAFSNRPRREPHASPLGTASSRAIVWVVWALAGAILLVLPYLVGPVISEALGSVMVFALLGLGLNIVVGYAGLLDLGYVFFFAVGAYSLALFTGAALNTFIGAGEPAASLDLNFYVAVPIVALVAAGAGLLIGAPVLRLRGDYLALVTLGLGEMVTVLVRSPWLTPLVGGPNGMRDITDASIAGFGFRDPQHFYYLAFAFVLFALFVSRRLATSRIGRAWTAMREDEQIANAMGVSTVRYKLLAFAMGGAIGSLGGALFAVKIGSLTPASFEVLVSISVLGIVILGGLGSLPGVIVGALVLVGLPQLLREFEEYRLLAYGAALVSVMVLRPQGLVPNVRRSRELRDEERAQDAWALGETPTDEEFDQPAVEPARREVQP